MVCNAVQEVLGRFQFRVGLSRTQEGSKPFEIEGNVWRCIALLCTVQCMGPGASSEFSFKCFAPVKTCSKRCLAFLKDV